jgi:hypothetical protein
MNRGYLLPLELLLLDNRRGEGVGDTYPVDYKKGALRDNINDNVVLYAQAIAPE